MGLLICEGGTIIEAYPEAYIEHHERMDCTLFRGVFLFTFLAQPLLCMQPMLGSYR